MKNLVSILYLNLVLQFTPLSYIDAVVMNNMNIFIGISVLHSVRMDGRRRRCGQHGLGYPFSPPEKKRKTKRFSLYHSTGMIVNSMNVCRNIALSTYRTLVNDALSKCAQKYSIICYQSPPSPKDYILENYVLLLCDTFMRLHKG